MDSNISEDGDDRSQLSYAFQNLSRLEVQSLPPLDKSQIYKIDLTENNFTGLNDLKFLIEFPNLKTLILDKNQIQSNLRMPLMSNLTTLWLNHNKIENLSIIIQNISEMCPNLKYLSMMNNKAAPSFFNGGSLTEHNDYRMFVISKLNCLTMLDDKEISAEEKSHSLSFYGKLKTRRKSSQTKKAKKETKQKIDDLTDESKANSIEPSLQELEFLPDVESTTSQLEISDLPDLPPVTP